MLESWSVTSLPGKLIAESQGHIVVGKILGHQVT